MMVAVGACVNTAVSGDGLLDGTGEVGGGQNC